MTDTILTLGGFPFLDPYGVPETINFGGAQHLVVHKLIGGRRVITALGPDDDAIRWRGRFRGAAAVASAELLDVMRRSGKPVVLSWWTFSYQVVVRHFRAQFERFYEVPYEIECEVVQDLTAAFWAGVANTLDSVIDGDLGLAGLFGNAVPAINTTLAAALTARAAVGTLQGASSGSLTGLAAAVGAVGAAAATAALAADTVSGAIGGITAGGDPGAMSAALGGTADTVATAAAGAQTAGVAGRLQSNLEPGTGLLAGGV
jgi:hypothetical protein